MKGLEILSCEDGLRELGMLRLEKRRLRGESHHHCREIEGITVSSWLCLRAVVLFVLQYLTQLKQQEGSVLCYFWVSFALLRA